MAHCSTKLSESDLNMKMNLGIKYKTITGTKTRLSQNIIIFQCLAGQSRTIIILLGIYHHRQDMHANTAKFGIDLTSFVPFHE